MRKLKFAFSDGAKESNPASQRILSLLTHAGLAEESDFQESDFLIYSDFGEKHWNFKGLKIYITGENMVPDFDQCDLAFSPLEDLTDSRCIRLPYFAQVLPRLGSLVRELDFDFKPILDRERFCCFVASNPRGPARNRFFKKLNIRKKVDSAGRHFNNWGRPIQNKIEFLKNYRFNLAFENSQSPGYITEKLIEPLLVGCIPIYWGAPDVARDFNPDCMINISHFSDYNEAIDYILAANADPSLRLKHLRATPFYQNKTPICLSDDYLLQPVLKLIESGLKPRPRKYRKRRLREHTFSSPLKQSIVSMSCRLEGLLWKLGWRK